ncbi:MAG: hypothetical protein ABW005_13370 [Burkholderiaceae bacterium]
MKHAGPEALQALQPLLDSLRALPGLTERKPGIFYRKSQAFLHFHEDALGLFADVKLGGPAFERLPVDTAAQRLALLQRLGQALGGAAPAAPAVPDHSSV